MKSILTTIRKSLYQLASKIDAKKPKADVIILCYHSIAADGWRFSVSLEMLQKQINHISKFRTPISLDELMPILEGKKELKSPSFIITFDDGYKNILSTVEFFQKNNIKPTVFVLSNSKEANKAELGNDLEFLSIDDIKSLKKAGWTIGVHSATHADFSKLTVDDMKREIEEPKINLEKQLGFAVPYFSYPKGWYSESIIDFVKKSDYKAAVSMEDGLISKKTDNFVIPRIGVDATHGLDEFKVLFSPSVIHLRGMLKKTFIANYFKS